MIAVIDADLIGRPKHNFPNLACMKISGYYKAKGYKVVLKRDYEGLEAFEKAADGKATKIIIPSEIQSLAGLAASVSELMKKDKE